MHKLTLFLAMAATAMGAIALHAEEPPTAVLVGDDAVQFPAPQGYFRLDGKSERMDTVMKRSFGKEVRMLIWYGSDVALAETLTDKMSFDRGLSFHATTGRLLEKEFFTAEQFKRLKFQIIQDSGAVLDGLDAAVAQNGAKAMSVLGEKAAQMRVGSKMALGVYDQTEDSVSYSLLLKLQTAPSAGAAPYSYVYVSAQSAIWTRNHVLSLDCGTIFHDGSDLDLVRKKMKDWKVAILLLNKS